MDGWSDRDFSDKIYNSEYRKADGPLPGYENAGARESVSYKNGVSIANLLGESKNEIAILDYGAGGNPGDTGLALMDRGFNIDSYDPHFGAEKISRNKYDFIYLIEVIEHVSDVDRLARELLGLLARDGLIYIQTLLHPFPTPQNILDSWYISPRNGHISIFTMQAMAILFRKYRANVVQTIFGMIVFREKPGFKNQFLL